MNALEFLRRVTRPMSMAEANQLGASRGAGRENATCDDTLSVQRAAAGPRLCTTPMGESTTQPVT
ncbi:hypothetical protein DES44_2235 [Roseateles depolymerans]|uniref:Uncharacterized protein n=1 Tax=Roseateles depolymerans TaxID=76731 RepID=A0A0U3E0U5_9BURK|nr:hypothetical protein RD2015_2286 [Roseateles depolymerans]REG19735.1 hypothetical protein DES44_2235 [Roseateles depolymerans]